MNSADLAEILVESHSLSRAEARRAIDVLTTAIVDAAARGEEVAMFGFGKFKAKQSPTRDGRNPTTGEPMTIPASRKLTFSQAKAVKDAINI